jgi:hypothetical protein
VIEGIVHRKKACKKHPLRYASVVAGFNGEKNEKQKHEINHFAHNIFHARHIIYGKS